MKGLGSSEKGNSWNYATTKYNGKVLLLAFIPQVNGMTKEEIVKILVEQVVAMGFRIRLITLVSTLLMCSISFHSLIT